MVLKSVLPLEIINAVGAGTGWELLLVACPVLVFPALAAVFRS